MGRGCQRRGGGERIEKIGSSSIHLWQGPLLFLKFNNVSCANSQPACPFVPISFPAPLALSSAVLASGSIGKSIFYSKRKLKGWRLPPFCRNLRPHPGPSLAILRSSSVPGDPLLTSPPPHLPPLPPPLPSAPCLQAITVALIRCSTLSPHSPRPVCSSWFIISHRTHMLNFWLPWKPCPCSKRKPEPKKDVGG